MCVNTFALFITAFQKKIHLSVSKDHAYFVLLDYLLYENMLFIVHIMETPTLPGEGREIKAYTRHWGQVQIAFHVW